ncbi:PaaI family thioesterase [Arthrobacter nitrophenolicus]|uniref:Hotdog fold thioesterase n=1 Tax=Arthrobacter nitrophenolicus TaxID=683150 RepID=A0A4R5Y5J3_9MICC|nr:hotdog fold thioesterase [Arthrobacter nitrophenolicus]TDL38927.1 hotdog fold thioesterase [Arthrobacter nitrophenolicus]
MDTSGQAERSETFSWTDPKVGLKHLPTMSGLDFLSGMRDGSIPRPPMASLMNLRLLAVENGRVEFECRPGEAHYNPLGVVHGGLACTLLDTVVGCAAHSTLAAGLGYTSIDLSVSYLRPITLQHAVLRAEGTVVKTGSRVIFAEGRVLAPDGGLLATATSSLLVFAAAPPAQAAPKA